MATSKYLFLSSRFLESKFSVFDLIRCARESKLKKDLIRVEVGIIACLDQRLTIESDCKKINYIALA